MKKLKNTDAGFTLIELLVVIFIIGTLSAIAIPSCTNQSQKVSNSPPANSGGVQDVIRGSYTPPFVPVNISVASNGELKVSVGGKISTPIGTFSASWERKKIHYLEVTLGNQTRFYPLGRNTFKIYLPNSLDGDTSVRYDGEGNVRIIVPNPGKVRFPN